MFKVLFCLKLLSDTSPSPSMHTENKLLSDWLMCDRTNVLKQQVVCSDMKTPADRYIVLLCTVLLRLAVCSPALVLDLSLHWGEEECPGEADWSQYDVLHCLQNQCPRSDGPGSVLKSGSGSGPLDRSLFIDSWILETLLSVCWTELCNHQIVCIYSFSQLFTRKYWHLRHNDYNM